MSGDGQIMDARAVAPFPQPAPLGLLGFAYSAYNIMHGPYNAKVDGQSDDSIALQRAVDDASAAGGGIVYIPPGVCIGTAQVSSSKVEIRGAGRGLTTLRQPATVARTITDGNIAATSNTLDSPAQANFANADLRQTIAIGDTFVARIVRVISATRVILDRIHPTGAGPGATVRVGCGRNVVEFNFCYLGNGAPAISDCGVADITIDGNKANVSGPVAGLDGDIVNHGVIWTACTRGYYRNVRAINCHNSGLDFVINSDYSNGEGAVVESSGSAVTGIAGFEVNSSHWCTFKGISTLSCYVGLRLLDNMWGNHIEAVCRASTFRNAILNNQNANASIANFVRIISSESFGEGIQVAGNWRGNNFDFVACFSGCTITGPDAITVNSNPCGILFGHESLSNALKPKSNHVKVLTYKNGGEGIIIRANSNVFDIVQHSNAQQTALGNYGTELNGSYNDVRLMSWDGDPGAPLHQQRGLVVRAQGGEVGTPATNNIVTISTPNVDSSGDNNATNTLARSYRGVSPDRGDVSVTLQTGVDAPEQRFAQALTANRTVTLSTAGAYHGARFRVVRQGLGGFTLDVGGLKTIPAGTAAAVEVECEVTATGTYTWRLIDYSPL